MDSSRLNAVAARVVAWHNRHPLARRIGVSDVHSVGYVVLPFVTPASAAPPAESAPADGAAVAGSLRERALARSLQGAAALPPPPKAAPADAMPAAAQAHFDEDFIDRLTPRQVARWARRHGRPLQTAPAGAPVREVLALPLAPGMQPLQVLVLTAAIDVGNSRRRVLLGPGDAGAVLGRRVPSLARGGLIGLLLAALVGATMLPTGDVPPSAPAASAAPAAVASAAAPTLELPLPAQAAEPAAPRPRLAAVDGAASAAATAPAAASAPVSAATVPDVEPRLGRVELTSLDLPRSQGDRAAARDAWLGAIGVSAMAPRDAAASSPPARLAKAAAPAASAPVAAAGPVSAPVPVPVTVRVAAPARTVVPAAPATFAVSSRLLRTRAEAEQVRDAMQALLQVDTNSNRSAADTVLQVDVLPQGDDFRVVGWPFGQRGQAEKARSVLVSRGMRVEVVAF